MSDASIQASAVGMTFPGGHIALRETSFSIRRGEFVSIVGPSGCGKSTLLRLIAGLIAPTTGRLDVDGLTPEESRRQRRVAFVFQDPNLLPWRTVVGNIRLPLELKRVPRREQGEAVEQSLRLIGLTEADAAKRPRMLSGGMRMRVSLARALVTRPDLLLLDEPFGALDDIMRQQLNEELARIWLERGWTGVFITHNVAEAVFLSQRILVMGAAPGTIVAKTEVPFPYPRPADLRAEPEFARLAGEVGRQLRGTAR